MKDEPLIDITVEFDEDNEPFFVFNTEGLTKFLREMADILVTSGLPDKTSEEFAENVVDGLYEMSLSRGEYKLNTGHTKH